MVNRITTVLDIDDKGFKSSLKGIGSAVGEADGFFGKLKAGGGAIFDTLKENAGAFAVAGGAALVAFGVKAVHAFEDTAKAAIDLSKASGLSIEDASRWIGVGDDYGVGADKLVSSIGKITKTLDSKKWEQYGIATRDASGRAKDANTILEDSLVRLSGVTNETERATIGNALFGKGYANLAPLVGHTREEYDKMLGSVEKGQVITEAEAAKAEKMRLAEDKLKDAFREVTLAVGQLVAALAPVITILADVTTGVSTAINDMENMNTSFAAGAGASDVFRAAVDKVNEAHAKLAGTLENAQTSTQGYSYAVQDAQRSIDELDAATGNSQGTMAGYSYAAKDAKDTTKRLADETAEATRKSDAFAKSIQEQTDKLNTLYGVEYDAVKAKYEYADAQSAAMLAVAALDTTLTDHKATQDDVNTATVAARDAIISQSEKFAGLEGAASGSEGAIRRQITSLEAQAASLAPGSPLRTFLEQYIADLAAIPSNVSTTMDLHISSDATNIGAAGYTPKGKKFAEGGHVDATPGGAQVTVAEAGQGEWMVPDDKMAALTTGGMTIGEVHFHVQTIPTPEETMRQLAKWGQRNGSGAFKKLVGP